jgi:MFS family permease
MDRSPRSNIRRLALGRLISVTGGAAAYTALNFAVFEKTRSPYMQALALLLTFGAAGLVGPFLGALGDRFDRRTVMIWSEATSTVFFTAMVFVDSPIPLILLAFGSAVADQPFYSASRAAIPSLAEDDEQISWANSLVTGGMHSGIFVGPLIGGVLYGPLGPSAVFAINAVSFVVSLLLTMSVRGRFQDERGDEPSGEHRGIAAGVVFLFREPVLRRLSIAWLVFVLGMGMGMVADARLADEFGAGAFGFGLLIACWGGGSALGTLAGRFMNARTEPVWMVLGAAGVTLAAFGTGLFPVFWLVLAALLAMGICDGLTIVAENGIMQRRTPDEVRSRTNAAFEAVLSLGLAVSYGLAGPVIELVGRAQVVYQIGGAFALGATLLLLPLLRLRAAPEPEAAPEEPLAAPGSVASHTLAPN